MSQPLQPPASPASASAAQTQWHFGPVRVDAGAREVRHGSAVIKTSPRMFDLLCLLLRNRHRVVPRDEIEDLLWPRGHVSSAALPQVIHKLRVVVDKGTNPPGGSWIGGSRGVGYRFVGEVAEHSMSLDAARPAHGDDPAQPHAASRARGVPVGARERALSELGRNQIRCDDWAGLTRTIATLREPASEADGGSRRRCLIWADIFECQLQIIRGDSSAMRELIESATLLLEGLDEAELQCELHTARGLYQEIFLPESLGLADYEAAWELAQRLDDPMKQAGCAASLAMSHVRLGQWADFERWTRTSLQLAAQCADRAIFIRFTGLSAAGWMDMGNRLALERKPDAARQAWSKALRLIESMLGEAQTTDVPERTLYLAQANRHILRGRLDPALVQDVVAELRRLMAQASRPATRIQIHHEMAAILHQAGHHDLALAECRDALADSDGFSINLRRDALLLLSAEASEAVGDLAGANAALRELLRWRSVQAAAQASRLAELAAPRSPFAGRKAPQPGPWQPAMAGEASAPGDPVARRG